MLFLRIPSLKQIELDAFVALYENGVHDKTQVARRRFNVAWLRVAAFWALIKANEVAAGA